MPTQRSTDLGDLERAVMTVLWDHGPDLNVRQVMTRLNSSRALAYTTVMTVLDRLTRKMLLERRRDGRAFRYTAAATREELTAASMRNGLNTLDTGDRRVAMLHFLTQSDAAELADLKEALAEVERRHP